MTLNEATVRLRGKPVLDAIDWSLATGEHWAVFGGNGSGKTTFLRLIAGQQWPVPGCRRQRIYDFGAGPEVHAVNALRKIRLVGPELQDRYHRFEWNPTGRALIATGYFDSPILRIRPKAEQRRAIKGLIEQLQIGHLADRHFLELSRGEQRKLLIARAVVSRPRMLLLDEVCDGLDPTIRQDLLGFIAGLCEKGTQLVFATHRRHEIPRTINRCVVLKDGRIVADGDFKRLDSAAETESVLPEPLPARRSSGAKDRDAELIGVANADLYRGDVRVLKGLNWKLQSGQHWLIRGDNGSGKSTLIKLLHADLRPALGGKISWFGLRNPVNVWALRKRLGLVSDELQSSYSDAATVYQCVATGFSASIGRLPLLDARQRRRIDEILNTLRLGAIRSMSIHRLSYGQFRRTLIARALVQCPLVLLLDEPTSGMDRDFAALIWSELLRLAGQGTHIVMASHEVEIVSGLFTHQLTLDDGRATVARLR